MTVIMQPHLGPATASRHRVFLLHGFELRLAAERVEITPASERLVAFLALQGRSVRRGFVSGSLWPDATTERANANLRSALWRVPVRDGTDPLVIATATHLGLHPDVDVDFHVASREAAVALRVDDPDVDRGMVDLFGADLLPDWSEDWVLFERERYRQLRLHALDHLCTTLIEHRRYGEAMLLAMSAVSADPLRESGHRLAVEIHLREGNLAEAVQQYQSYASRLAEELGALPSTRLRRLLERCGVRP